MFVCLCSLGCLFGSLVLGCLSGCLCILSDTGCRYISSSSNLFARVLFVRLFVCLFGWLFVCVSRVLFGTVKTIRASHVIVCGTTKNAGASRGSMFGIVNLCCSVLCLFV